MLFELQLQLASSELPAASRYQYSLPNGPSHPSLSHSASSCTERRVTEAESSKCSTRSAAVGVGDDEIEAVAVDELSNLTPQMASLLGVEPDHDVSPEGLGQTRRQ